VCGCQRERVFVWGGAATTAGIILCHLCVAGGAACGITHLLNIMGGAIVEHERITNHCCHVCIGAARLPHTFRRCICDDMFGSLRKRTEKCYEAGNAKAGHSPNCGALL
jgi:hypothetical protein